MAITSPALPPIPPPQVPIVDASGRVTVEWYNYLKGVETLLRIVLTKVT